MQNVKIIVNGTVALVNPEENFEFIFRNPLLDYSQVIGPYSTPISLPFCNVNNKIFKNANNFYSPENTQLYKVEIYLFSDLKAEGYLRLKDTNGAYNLYFTSSLGEIFAGKKDDLLETIMPVVSIASREAQVAGAPNIVFPTIQNAGFYTQNPVGGWANMVNDHNGTLYTGPTYVAAVKIKYVLQQIATACGFSLSGAWFANADMDNAYIMQNVENTSLNVVTADAVRGLTPRTFIAYLRSTLGLRVTADIFNKVMAIDFAKSYFEAEVAYNWSEFCGQPISGRNNLGLSGIKLSYNLNSEDKQTDLAAILQDYSTVTSDAEAKYMELSSPLQPIPMSNGLPIMEEAGRTSQNKQDTKKLVPRIFFYKGLQSTSFGNRPLADYIFSSYDLSNIGRKTTLFSAEESFWRDTFEANFPIRKLSRINLNNLSQKVHIHGINYMPKEIIVNSKAPSQGLLKCLRV